jgi:Rad3-related DNA helicase
MAHSARLPSAVVIDRGLHEGSTGNRGRASRRGGDVVFAALEGAGRDGGASGAAGSGAYGKGGVAPEAERRLLALVASHGDSAASAAAATLAGPRQESWSRAEARERLVGALVVVPRRAGVESWLAHEGEGAPLVFGLDELAGFLSPGGLGADFEKLLALRAGARAEHGRAGLDAAGPLELMRAARALVESVHALAVPELAALGHAWNEAAVRLERERPREAARIAALARFVDRPSVWSGASDGIFATPQDAGAAHDGRLAAATAEFADLELALAESRPGWEFRSRGGSVELENLPPHHEEVQPLGDADLERVHDALAKVLPSLGGARVAHGRPLEPRDAQVEIGDRIAQSLGRREHLLLHAPTGTGKTLAYLVPGLLFAVRNGVRIGLSTYTKALQRQAYDRDLPLALELLARVGLDPAPRVCVLKGRSNYVCWRALVSLAPGPADGAARHLSFCHALAFALTSSDGDVDRFASIGLAPFEGVENIATEWELLRRSFVARSGCCSRRGARGLCGADAARLRAETCHGVITNHAFALARPEFFRHVVFDECEHLHDQAHGAFSRALSLERARRLVDEVSGNRGRGPLEALRRTIDGALSFGAAQAELSHALTSRTAARSALERLVRRAREFCDWRTEQEKSRDRGGEHALLREWLTDGLERGAENAQALVSAHSDAGRHLTELSTSLRALSDGLFEVPVPRKERVRFELDALIGDLEELLDALLVWLPMRDGALAFDDGTFHDALERGNDVVLETRVLLPHEHLGRFHYPKLAGAVYLSATTLLRGGFDDARRYLGLERAASPAPEEERPPENVATHAAPESFDYSRVCVCVPSDVPDYRADKRGWMEHGARLVAHLAERTGGRLLALYTNQEDLLGVARLVRPYLAERGIEVLAQNTGTSAERLAERFRTHGRAVLLGVDAFWFGADFPGEALEYLVIAKLPYGVPDRYHHAQCAALGKSEQRRAIYLPRALARFRQGFGRLMRRADDSGCVFVLDRRVTEPQHRLFLRELPLAESFVGPAGQSDHDGDQHGDQHGDFDAGFEGGGEVMRAGSVGRGRGARLVRAETDRCIAAAFEHMALAQRVRRADLFAQLGETRL